MRNAEQILIEFDFIKADTDEGVYRRLKDAVKQAMREAIREAAEVAEIKESGGIDSNGEGFDVYEVNKQSILSLLNQIQ